MGLHIKGVFFFMCRSVEVCNLSTFSHLKVLTSNLFLERKKDLTVAIKEEAPVDSIALTLTPFSMITGHLNPYSYMGRRF